MDELEGCDVCGGNHNTEECPELGLAVSRESPLQTKARLTLPQGLDAVTDDDGNTMVVALQPVPTKTQFGPFEARKTTFNIDADNVFVLKVFTKDGGVVCYDTTDENFCNWLCLVRTATSPADQNLIAYTLGVNVFYNSTRDIAAGNELRVWYAPAYAKKLGRSPTPNGVTRTMLGEMLIFQEDDSLSQTEHYTSDSTIPVDGNLENQSVASGSVLIKQEALFQCTQCGAAFHNQSDYVRHLREHLMPTRDRPVMKSSTYKCKTCQVGFNTYSNYNRHMKKHSGSRIQCPICKHNTYRADLFTTHYVGKHKQTYDEAKRILWEHSAEKAGQSDGGKEDLDGKDQDGERVNVVRRKRGRPRKKPKVEVSEEEEEKMDEDEQEGSDTGAVDGGKDKADCEKGLMEVSKESEKSDSVTCEKRDREAGEKNEEEVEGQVSVKMEPVTPVRRQPQRSLKGRRITGKLAESDSDESPQESRRVESHVITVTASGKKPGRGRPRKILPVSDSRDDVEASPRKEEKAIEYIRVSKSQSEDKESESALENEVIHVLIGLGEGHGGNTELVKASEPSTEHTNSDKEDVAEAAEKLECASAEQNQTDKPETPESSFSEKEEYDQDEEDKDFVPEAHNKEREKRKIIVKRGPGRPPGSYRKRTIDPEILQLEKLTRVEQTAVGKVYGCGVCGKKFSQQSYLRLHLPRHTAKFRCKYCKKSFTRKESYQKHDCGAKGVEILTQVKFGQEVYICDECKKSFPSWEEARQHTLQHSKAFTCHLCHKSFSRRHELLDHVCHSESKDLFQCEICQQEFKTLRYLYRHMAMHTDIFKCDSCGKNFSRKDSLQRHLLRCNPEMASEQNIFPCTICKKVFSTKLGLENHQINCARFVCETCKLAFFTEENLDQHKCMGKMLHGDTNIHYACTECGKSFASINYLRRHELNHTGGYTCNICEKSFAQRDQYIMHEKLCWAKREIETVSFVECDICKEQFEDPKLYRDHYQSHTHPHKCEKCGKRFIRVGTLAMHVCSTAKEEDQTVACMQCNKLFKNQRALERHEVKHGEPTEECEYCKKKFHKMQDHICHMPDGSVVRVVVKKNRLLIKENLVCHECGRSFVSVSNLNKHVLIHGERQNECDICGKKFHYANYLREHKKMVHMKAYRLQCSDCGKVLFSKAGLIAHIRQFHDNEIKLFQCTECPKTFRQKGNLKTHMFSHTKEKNFTCEFCGKKFKYPDQHNRHRLEHTMTDKIQCEHCDKSFCREYQLRKHVELHHSSVVYVCEVCHERCSHRHTIIRHYKRKHPTVAYLFDENPDYIEMLQRPINPAEKQRESVTVKMEPVKMENVKMETVIATDANGIEQAYTIQTEGDENYLPQVAAEALQNLSSGAGQTELEDGGTVSTIEGPDGEQTVVILHIVNTDGTSVQEESVEEVQTMIEEEEVVTETN